MNSYDKHFNTWTEFVDFAANAPQKGQTEKRVRDNIKLSFQRVKTWKDVLQLATDGWEQGTAIAKTFSQGLFDGISNRIEKLEVSHDVEGHSIDIGRFVDGEPEAWMKFEDVIQEDTDGHKLLKIVFNGGASGSIDGNSIIHKGAAIVALIELLEYAGHRVELELITTNARDCDFPSLCNTSITLKQYDQSVNLNNIAYALAHPSCFRGLMFSYWETLPQEYIDKLSIGYTYGISGILPENRKGDIYIDSMISGGEINWNNISEVNNWILDQLEKQGIKLNKKLT